MKKVGILTFFKALNFGANLQACSTYFYLKNHGYDPVFINYSPNDAIDEDKLCPPEQVRVQREFQSGFKKTESCHNSKEVAEVLHRHGIFNVIIGSDAVAQHHPLSTRIVFPSRRIVSVMHPSQDKMFPNPFWGEFLDYAPDTNVCLMSVSSQNCSFPSFPSSVMKQMNCYIKKFKYVSVRDEWTQRMYSHITSGGVKPLVTPDPVFGFNYNCADLLPAREEILTKFQLPEKYILLGIRKGKSVEPQWSKNFEIQCHNRGYECIGLPFPYGFTPQNQIERKVNLPLSPIEWYAIIKYSLGYVGHNMHTIVSALHNNVPCYSFDQYGVRTLMQWCDDRSSKIWDILNRAGFSDYRAVSGTIINKIPEPSEVLDKILSFDINRCRTFSERYYQLYIEMMRSIEQSFA